MLQGNFFNVISIQTGEGFVKADLAINAGHRIFEGHFPGTPVVPGVCMMQMVKEIIEDVVAKETTLERADHMKFLAVFNPIEKNSLQLDLKYISTENGRLSVVASLFNDGVVYFKFKGWFVF